MNLKIINGEHFITFISPGQLPENLRTRTLVFYLPQRDAIVINEGCLAASQIADFAAAYLELDNCSRKSFKECCVGLQSVEAILGIAHLLDRIIRIRRMLYSRKEKR